MTQPSFYQQLLMRLQAVDPQFSAEFSSRYETAGIWTRIGDEKSSVYMFIRTQLPTHAQEARSYLAPASNTNACIREIIRYVYPALKEAFAEQTYHGQVLA
jgi:hypothetical protein